MILKSFLYKNKHYIEVVLVPNFYLSAMSSLLFLAFFLHVYKKHPMAYTFPTSGFILSRVHGWTTLCWSVSWQVGRLVDNTCAFLAFSRQFSRHSLSNRTRPILPFILPFFICKERRRHISCSLQYSHRAFQ